MEVVRRKFKTSARRRRVVRASLLRSRLANPRKWVMHNKKGSCKRLGIPFDEELLNSLECPAVCPVLGTPISFEQGKGHRPAENTASFERIDPSLGYVRGNVVIISKKANTMKSNATLDELIRFATWIMSEQAHRFAPV